MKPDVLVVGAGLVGAACADALARTGQRVLVLDPRPPGSGATAAGMGHIVVMDDSEAEFTLTEYSRRLWLELRRELPREAEFELRGTLWVAADEAEMQTVRAKQAYYAARGVHAEVLDAGAMAEAEPNLRAGLAGGLRVPEDAVVYAPTIAPWLLRRCELRLAEVAEARAGSVKLTSGEVIFAGAVVVANGTWASALFPALPVRPRKGHLAITDRYPGFVKHQLVEQGYHKSAHRHDNESVAFNVQPRSTGQLLIGSSRQYGVADREIDASFLARMLRRAVEYMPALRALNVIRTWTGFRAATPDSLPIIGPWNGLWLATGHEGLGITTSLATGRLICDSILGRMMPIPAEPYLPSRYVQ